MIDTHAHLFLEEFNDDLPQVVQRARVAGVTRILLPNIDSTTIEPMWQVCRTYPGYCYPMIGLHPTSVKTGYEAELEIVHRELTTRTGYIAVGEIGIDLYWDKTYQAWQEIALRKQLEWALQYHLPVVLHCREAFDTIYKVLSPFKETPLSGVFHSFTGTADEARCIIREFPRFYIGINGVVTFKKSALPETLAEIPLDRLLIETDAPYLTPVPYRGKRNESAYLQYTLQKVAELCKIAPKQLDEATSANARKLFGDLGGAGEDFKVY
ncbi:MAG: TatD family hydrolase [Mediterranea sp.]|jgi:TatD DNase family protein|nr:TatD family hydrolase [Mediterranea sp.]